ncbi:hypothetical protein [Kitasatospora sp. NE20-6]|uniref:hypothetical protein n=1 Tax=Kitasatospora sp. NE20-6 TaxID=2859066 RepID=UPI0038B41263
MSEWWMRRRDGLLAQLASLLTYFGADPVDDPGIGELARTAVTLAGEYRDSDRGPTIRRAGVLLQEAATELHTADRFRGTLLPLVSRHLRHAAALLRQARSCLEAAADPAAGERPHTGAVR